MRHKKEKLPREKRNFALVSPPFPLFLLFFDMTPLNLPPVTLKTQTSGAQTSVFDFLRRRYVRLTPEEWVRQHFTHFLVTHKHYPQGLLANEVTVMVGGVARRCDTVLYHRQGGSPRVIIDYKAPSVPITAATFRQACSYNSVLKADYIFVSNGLTHYCCRIDYRAFRVEYLNEIPDYDAL